METLVGYKLSFVLHEIEGKKFKELRFAAIKRIKGGYTLFASISLKRSA
jgi:hypothetical protein